MSATFHPALGAKQLGTQKRGQNHHPNLSKLNYIDKIKAITAGKNWTNQIFLLAVKPP